MHQNFELFFARVLKDEGTGYEDVAGDNGGPTKCGITIFDVARWHKVKLPAGIKIAQLRQHPAFPDLVKKVHEIDPVTAGVIYKAFYWDPLKADELPAGLDYCVADYGVNSGTGKAAHDLGGLVGVKGPAITDEMVRAVASYGSLPDLIEHFQDERRAYLEEIGQYPHNRKFKKGWLDREARVRKLALDLAKSAEPLKPLPATLPKAMADEGPWLIPATDAPAGEPGPVARAVSAATSPTLWSILLGVGAYVGNAFQHALDFVGNLIGHIPDISDTVSEFYRPATNLLDVLQVKSVRITIYIGIACLAVAVIRVADRHLRPKS